MRPQTDEEVMAGLLPVAIDGQEVLLPVLRREQARAWRAQLSETFGQLMDTEADTPAGSEAMSDAQLDLIVAYDLTGVLGDRESLDRRITEAQQDAIYNRLVEISYPFVQSQAALYLAIIQQVAASRSQSSTSSDSPPGDSAPQPLTRSSRTSSSSISGRRRKSA